MPASTHFHNYFVETLAGLPQLVSPSDDSTRHVSRAQKHLTPEHQD
jgi:hypothetical protein